MQSLHTIKTRLRHHLPELKKNYFVEELGVFGSYVREEQSDHSDLDLLVSFSKTPTLFEYMCLNDHLESYLGIQVDLVMKHGLKKYLAPFILKEVQYV